MRALLYMYCSGLNQSTIDPEQFIAGVNRFALDNPIPTITSRLAWYGNEENSTKAIFEWLEKRIKDTELYDKENFTNQSPSGNAENATLDAIKNKESNLHNMSETKLKASLKKKICQVEDFYIPALNG